MADTLLQALPLPAAADPNVRCLAQWKHERFTGGTSATLTLANKAIAGLEQVYKNGTLLDANKGTPDYTLSGATLTLGTAPLSTDIIRVFYFFTAS